MSWPLEKSFLSGKSILVTGVTGFVGKAVLELILRDHLPQVKQIFCLVRGSAAKSAKERLGDVLAGKLFDKVRDQLTRLSSKIVVIEGDMDKEGLGISQRDLSLLKELNYTIHVAASVEFVSSLLSSFRTNTLGTVQLLDICQQSTEYQGFVYVSTCFVNSNLNPGEPFYEKLYPMPLGDPKSLFHQIEKMDAKQADKFNRKVLKEYPNNYIFVKALTEHLISKSSHVQIARLSCVTSTVSEPVPGWSDGFFGLNGAIISIGSGVLDSLVGDPKHVLDCVPVDYAASCLLRITRSVQSENQIYHLANSTINPTTYELVVQCVLKTLRSLPPFKFRLFPPDLQLIKCPKAHDERAKIMNQFKFHHLPSLLGNEKLAQMLARTEKKVNKIHASLNPASGGNWAFGTDNMLALELSQADDPTITSSKINYERIKTLDWETYFFQFVCGIIRYVLHEDLPDEVALTMGIESPSSLSKETLPAKL